MRLLQRFARPRATSAVKPAAPLSGREIEVVRAIARGRTNQEVGAELFISVSTVKTHVASIQMKLGLRNRVEVAAWAWENRLTQPDLTPLPDVGEPERWLSLAAGEDTCQDPHDPGLPGVSYVQN